MPQFALSFSVELAQQETLADYLNAVLIDQPTWQVVAIDHYITSSAPTIAVAKPQPILLATVVFSSPVEDMPKAEPAKS